MTEQSPKRRGGNPSWVKGGPSPNPSGRPRTGFALSERIRERMSPDELIDLVTRALADESIDLDRRVAFAFQLADRAYSKPAAGLDVSVTKGADEPDYSNLSDEQIRELLAHHERVLATTAPDDQRLPEPTVSDDDNGRDT